MVSKELTIVSRRHLLGLGACVFGVFAAPRSIFAGSLNATAGLTCIEEYPNLTEAEINDMVHRQAMYEAEEIIAQAEREILSNRALNGRPTYSTVYGNTYTSYTGWHYPAGQPAGGVSFGNTSGMIYVNLSGGGLTPGISLPLPGGLGSISFSLPLTKRSLSVTGYGVKVPGGGRYYKAKCNCAYKVQPYVVYETVNGVKRVYMKATSKVFNSIQFILQEV